MVHVEIHAGRDMVHVEIHAGRDMVHVEIHAGRDKAHRDTHTVHVEMSCQLLETQIRDMPHPHATPMNEYH